MGPEYLDNERSRDECLRSASQASSLELPSRTDSSEGSGDAEEGGGGTRRRGGC